MTPEEKHKSLRMVKKYNKKSRKRDKNGGLNRITIGRRLFAITRILYGATEPQTVQNIMKKTGYSKTTTRNYLYTLEIIAPKNFYKDKRSHTGVGRWRYVYYME